MVKLDSQSHPSQPHRGIKNMKAQQNCSYQAREGLTSGGKKTKNLQSGGNGLSFLSIVNQSYSEKTIERHLGRNFTLFKLICNML